MQTIFIRSIKSNSLVRILIHTGKLVVNTVVGSGGVVGIAGDGQSMNNYFLQNNNIKYKPVRSLKNLSKLLYQ